MWDPNAPDQWPLPSTGGVGRFRSFVTHEILRSDYEKIQQKCLDPTYEEGEKKKGHSYIYVQPYPWKEYEFMLFEWRYNDENGKDTGTQFEVQPGIYCDRRHPNVKIPFTLKPVDNSDMVEQPPCDGKGKRTAGLAHIPDSQST